MALDGECPEFRNDPFALQSKEYVYVTYHSIINICCCFEKKPLTWFFQS